MKKILKQSFRTLQTFRLTDEERRDVRTTLAAYLTAHPRPTHAHVYHQSDESRVDVAAAIGTTPARAGVKLFFPAHLFGPRIIAGAFVGVVVLGTSIGISRAAEFALPGTLLYPVKIHINEPVRLLANQTPEARAQVQLLIVERRLEEAEQLAVLGKLENIASASLETRMQQATGNVYATIETFAANDDLTAASRISTRLSTTLRAHQEIIISLSANAKSNTTTPRTISIVTTIENETITGDEVSSGLDKSLSDKKSARQQATATQRKLEAQQAVTRAEKTLEEIKANLTETVYERLVERLNAAQAMIQTGDETFAEEQFADAFRSFDKALRGAEALAIILKAEGRLRKSAVLEVLEAPQETADATTTETITPRSPRQPSGIRFVPRTSARDKEYQKHRR